MRIGINASFLRKPNTGIGQVTANFLKKMAEFPDAEFNLYLEEDNSLNLPKNFTKKIFLPIWKRDDLIRKIWWEKCSLPKKAKKDGCDVFITLYHCPTILSGNTKHIMLVHDIIPELFHEYLNNSRKKLYWNLTKKAIQKVDKIVAISSRTEKDLIQHLGIEPEKISVNYIDVDPIYKKEISDEHIEKVLKKYDLNRGYILNGGGLEVRKNTERLIRAYKILLDRNKNEHFVENLPPLVISGKLLSQLAPLVCDAEKLIKELNLTEHVKLLDFVPQEDLSALYKGSLFFIYPSLYEGFGLPVLEAMNQGVPVITSKNSSLPEVGGDAVLYCHPEDEKDIYMVMRNLILKKDLLDTLSERGKERAKRFSWDEFVKKLFNIIKELK
jgi:glycosyltransferase involved in cell wall biosynthesis